MSKRAVIRIIRTPQRDAFDITNRDGSIFSAGRILRYLQITWVSEPTVANRSLPALLVFTV